MKWILVLWLYAHGHLVSVDHLHGFAHRSDCELFARDLRPAGELRYQCVVDPQYLQTTATPVIVPGH